MSSPLPRPPRVLNLVSDPTAVESRAPVDWSTWYLLEEDDVGQSPEQDDVARVFESALREHARLADWRHARVGKDAFFAWVAREPNVRVSPDVYVLDDPPPPPWPKMWKTWLAGHRPPRFALEIVSEEWRKDYEDNPPKYAMLGAQELILFDPEVARGAIAHDQRHVLQHYRRTEDGLFVCLHQGGGPVFSETIDAWIVSRPEAGVGWVRLARDPEGTQIVPTSEERAEHEAARAEQEAARAEQEAARAEQEAARAERLAEQLRKLGVDPASL